MSSIYEQHSLTTGTCPHVDNRCEKQWYNQAHLHDIHKHHRNSLFFDLVDRYRVLLWWYRTKKYYSCVIHKVIHICG